MHPLPDAAGAVDQAPEVWEECVEFGFHTITIEKAGTLVPQHVHDDSHATLVCAGRARGWTDGAYLGEKGPGEAFWVEGGKKHHFQAVEPITRLSCITHLPSMKKKES